MTISKDETKLSELDRAIAHYSQALDKIDLPPGPSTKDAMEVLTARDAVQAALNEEPLNSAKSRATVCKLDSRLKKLEKAIASAGSLPEWRESLQPPESAWWWFFQPPLNPWMRLDWLWNALTISALALSASLIVTTLQSLAIKGLTWQQSFGAILQGAGLAAIGSGALTSEGQEKVRNILKKTGVPERFQSEATLVVSLIVLGGVWSLYNFLPGRLYENGLENYQLGELSEAEENFLQALQLDPDDERINIALGEVYESLGDLDRAIAQYKQALSSGNPQAFNNLGRLYIDRIDPILKRKNKVLAETYLRMGLQRALTSNAKQEFTDEELVNIKYQLYRNLGWALLEQKKYPEAESALKTAIEFDNQIDKLQIGSYMSECLLAKLYEIQGSEQQQQVNLRDCRMLARPETLNEYRQLVVNEGKLADCIDTDDIVTGLDKLPVEFNEYCRALAVKEPLTAVTDPAQIEALRQKISEKIQQLLDPNLSEKFQQLIPQNDESDDDNDGLVYWVTVGEGGDVVAFEPTNKLASDGVQYTPIFRANASNF